MSRVGPNNRAWTPDDVENWYETEGTAKPQGLPALTQRDQNPLRKIGKALSSIGTARNGQIRKMEDAARFAAAMRGRFKTRKGCEEMRFT